MSKPTWTKCEIKVPIGPQITGMGMAMADNPTIRATFLLISSQSGRLAFFWRTD